MKITPNIGIILLAAGSSSRLGQSKQLLPIKGEALLRRTTRVASSCGANPVIVVLGANYEQHAKVINDLPVFIHHNTEWERGMGSSIKAGLRSVLHQKPETEAVILLVCDQPLLREEHLTGLVKQYRSDQAGIVASHYGDTAGVPALFARPYFQELLNLDQLHGAKTIIEKHPESLQTVEFPEGVVEIDYPHDYEEFIKRYEPEI